MKLAGLQIQDLGFVTYIIIILFLLISQNNKVLTNCDNYSANIKGTLSPVGIIIFVI